MAHREPRVSAEGSGTREAVQVQEGMRPDLRGNFLTKLPWEEA